MKNLINRKMILIILVIGIILIIVLGLYVKMTNSQEAIHVNIPQNTGIWYCQGCAWNKAHTFISCQTRRSTNSQQEAHKILVKTLCSELNLADSPDGCDDNIIVRENCGKVDNTKKAKTVQSKKAPVVTVN